MTPELWGRLKPLYHAALDLPEEHRTAFVERLCVDDAMLARELFTLLAAEQQGSSGFETPLLDLSTLLPARPAMLEPGEVLAGRFRILRHLGSGGMGDVYEACDEQMEQGRIALKTIRPAIAENPAALARFKDEVRLARRVSGVHVCRIHELYLGGPEVTGPSMAFLTMELLDGVTLHDRIARASPLPLAEISRIAEQLCTALCCIHEAGVVHQDLKPRNVILVPHGGAERAVVMDFGLARTAVPALDDMGSGSTPGLVAGTPNYMAPEQFEGRDVGPETDIYALGLILYELATGIQPFAAHTPLAAAIRRSKQPVHASTLRHDLPPAWDRVIARCLRYDPEQRFRSAEEVKAALARHDTMVLRWGEQRRIAVPHLVLVAMGVTALLLVCAGLWLQFFRPRHRELSPDAAHWYELGITAMREGSYLKATRLLGMVTQRDPTYALAHAALAEAWTELDFTDAAQKEMLLAAAPDEQHGLSEMDRRYIDAVRTTLIRDYSAAAQDYEEILQRLPQDAKAQGYVDLGRIYEKAGKFPETLASYERAARLNPDDPAPFLHLGILKSRQRDAGGAEQAFNTAERLYGAESDLEGLAEVEYQRGYAANDASLTQKANQHLDHSLAIARQIPSVQLEVRTLSQLSSVAYNDSKDEQAITYANQEMALARENGLEYWVADGMTRLGNAYLDKEDYPAAEQVLQDGLQRAKAAGHPRVEATANLTLASVRFNEQRWDEDISFAQRALRYFQDYGFLDHADRALVLIARAQRSKGEYAAALKTGNQLLSEAESAKSPGYTFLAEELLGGILVRLERFPEALTHYSRALDDANALQQNVAFEQIGEAQVLWQMGRYEDASKLMQSLPETASNRLSSGVDAATVRAFMKLSQGDPRAALAILQDARMRFPQLRNDNLPAAQTLLQLTALSEAALGQKAAAKQACARLEGISKAQLEVVDIAQIELTLAQVDLVLGDATSARQHAQTAEVFFSSQKIAPSDALSLLAAAEAAEALGDNATANVLSKKSVDIFRQVAQSWGVPVFHQYLLRPDRQQTVRTLSRLRAANGDQLDAIFL